MSYDPRKRRRRAKDPLRADRVKRRRTGRRRYDPVWRERAKGVLGRVTDPFHRFIGGMLGNMGLIWTWKGLRLPGYGMNLINTGVKTVDGREIQINGDDVIPTAIVGGYEYAKGGGRSKWAGVVGSVVGMLVSKFGIEGSGADIIQHATKHEGGDITKTGWYYLEEGEKVVPKTANKIDLTKPMSIGVMYN